MTRIESAPGIVDDFDRLFDHIAEFGVVNPADRLVGVQQALQVLQTSPLIGRPIEGGRRELVIGRGSRGHVALYRYVPEVDTVFLLAIRHQREAGYARDT